MSPVTVCDNNNNDFIKYQNQSSSEMLSARSNTSSLGLVEPSGNQPNTKSFNKMFSYSNVLGFLAILLLCGIGGVNGLKCYMCGQYNEGVGSITPCLNYSEKYAHLYLKECSKKTEQYCVKYVSELSIVRDCATECAEKEIWETNTYCCNEDGCNGASTLGTSGMLIMLPVLYFAFDYFAALLRAFKMGR